jgi:uncharacterized protein involved in exopolysaccharide biosynthesis
LDSVYGRRIVWSFGLNDQPLHSHWHDLYVRRWLILLTLIVAAGAAWEFSLLVTPVYQAKTTFFLAAGAATPEFVGQSPDAAPRPLLPMPDEKTAALDVGILRGGIIMDQIGREFGMTAAEAAKKIVVTVSGEFMIDAFVRDVDADRAMRMANALPPIYARFHQDSMRERAAAIAGALASAKANLEQERADLADDLQSARRDSLSTADMAALSELQSRREAAQVELDALLAQIDQAEARRIALDQRLRDEAGLYRQGLTMESTQALDDMLSTLLRLRVERASAGNAPNNPNVRAIEEQMAEIESSMERERKRLAEAAGKTPGSLFEQIRLEYALTVVTLAGLNASRDAAAGRVTEATDRFLAALASFAEATETESRLAALSSEIATVDSNLAAARIQAENIVAPLVVVERASLPSTPAFPLPILNAIVAGLTGLMLGCFYALILAHNDRMRQTAVRLRATVPLFDEQELRSLDLDPGIGPWPFRPRNGVRNG